MGNTCNWCNTEAPYLQAVEIETLIRSNDHPEIALQNLSICKHCEQELKDYEASWQVLSHG